MKDLREKLDRLRAEARNLALIGRTSQDASQRELFGRMAEQLALEALELEQVVKNQSGHLGSNEPPCSSNQPNIAVLNVSARRTRE